MPSRFDLTTRPAISPPSCLRCPEHCPALLSSVLGSLVRRSLLSSSSDHHFLSFRSQSRSRPCSHAPAKSTHPSPLLRCKAEPNSLISLPPTDAPVTSRPSASLRRLYPYAAAPSFAGDCTPLLSQHERRADAADASRATNPAIAPIAMHAATPSMLLSHQRSNGPSPASPRPALH